MIYSDRMQIRVLGAKNWGIDSLENKDLQSNKKYSVC